MMDEASLQRVCSLATSLKHSAHLLLDHQHKLSLDTWTLSEVQAAFSLILEVEQHTNFHVLPQNHRHHPAIPHLQFVYDLLQKIPGLRLWARDGLPPGSAPLSVRCFRSVMWLEIEHVPITGIKALQTLRPSLRSITVCRALTSLQDLFVRCGADNASEFAWESLQEAVLSHNTLQSLDPSLSLLPNLKVLDLSHCELHDVSALSHLSCVKVLNLSHNQLAIMPTLSPSASDSLTILDISHNFISHLAGLEELSNLEDIDLGANLLSLLDVLGVLGALGKLNILSLIDNPLTFYPHYRSKVIRILSPRIANKEVILDGQPLTSQEHNDLGLSADLSSFAYSQDLMSSLSSLPSPVASSLPTPTSPSQPVFSLGPQPDSLDSQPSSLMQGSLTSLSRSAGNGQPKRKSKKKRTRHIAITDPDCEEEEGDRDDNVEGWGPDSIIPSSVEVLPQPPPPSLAAPSTLQHTSPPDTLAFAALTLKAGMSTPAPEQNDRLLEEILQSKPQSGTPTTTPTRLVKNAQTSGSARTKSTVDENRIEDNRMAEDDENGNREEFREATSPDTTLESGFYKREMDVSVASSGDFSPAHSDSEEDTENEVHRVLAQKELESKAKVRDDDDGKGEMLLEDVILAVTDTQFKEKHSITTRTLYRWDLVTLESAETLVCESWVRRLHLTFATLRPAYKTRTYILAPEDYQSLQDVLAPILERNTLKIMLSSAMKCLKCQAQFSRDCAQSSRSSVLQCPTCKGGVVVRVENVDHPGISSSPLPPLGAPPPLLPPGLSSTPTQLPSQSGTVLMCGEGQGESSESVSVCSDGSVRRESDVEVISNPSVSSIEVLPDQLIIQDVIVEEDGVSERSYSEGLIPPVAAVNVDARTPPATSSPSPATLHHKHDAPPTNMQESSSSGSMTGSVCTTYERPRSSLTNTTSPLRTPAPSSHTLTSHNTTSMETTYDTSSAMYQTADSSMLAAIASSSSPAHHSPGTSPALGSSCTSVDTVKNGNAFGPGSLEGDKTKMLHHKGMMTSMREEEAEEGQKYSLASWVQSLLHTLTGYYWVWWEEVPEADGKVQRASNPIRYSYEDFAVVDHRLKLHCDVVLFHEQQEELLGLVKGVLLVKGGRREFHGVLAISNKKLYVLEIVGPEDDSPQSWLELHSSHSLGDVSCIHSLYQRQGLAFSVPDSLILISLADPHRANCLFNFLSDVLDEHGVSPSIEEASPAQEEAMTKLVALAAEITPAAATPSVFSIVSLLMEGGCSESQFLVVTEADLVLFHADLSWYLPPSPASSSTLTLNCTQKIANITTIEVGSASHISLQFQDEVTGKESTWDLHVVSEVAACHIIQAIRTPWSHLFSIDLQEFIGVYRSKEGDVLTVKRVNLESDEEEVQESEGELQSQKINKTRVKKTTEEREEPVRWKPEKWDAEKENEAVKWGVQKSDIETDIQKLPEVQHVERKAADVQKDREKLEWDTQKIDKEIEQKLESKVEEGKTQTDWNVQEIDKEKVQKLKSKVEEEIQTDWNIQKEKLEWDTQKFDKEKVQKSKSKEEEDKTQTDWKLDKEKLEWEKQDVVNETNKLESGSEMTQNDGDWVKSGDEDWYEVEAVASKPRYDTKYPILGYSDGIPTLVTSPDEEGT